MLFVTNHQHHAGCAHIGSLLITWNHGLDMRRNFTVSDEWCKRMVSPKTGMRTGMNFGQAKRLLIDVKVSEGTRNLEKCRYIMWVVELDWLIFLNSNMFGFSFIINSQYCLPELGLVCAEPEKQIKAGDNTLSFSLAAEWGTTEVKDDREVCRCYY